MGTIQEALKELRKTRVVENKTTRKIPFLSQPARSRLHFCKKTHAKRLMDNKIMENNHISGHQSVTSTGIN